MSSAGSSSASDLAGAIEHTSWQLLARVRLGDSGAIGQLLARHLPRLRRWARGKLSRHARASIDTSDVIQDVVTRTLPRIGALDLPGRRALGAYLQQAVRNRICDEHRYSRRRGAAEALADDVVSDAPSPLDRVLARENEARYRAALASVSSEDRDLIVGHVELGYSHAKLGVMTNRSANAARMALQRAIGRLAERMHDG